MKNSFKISFIAIICAVLCSCNGYDKLLKSTDYDKKYTEAKRYYDEGKYRQAKDLFENLVVNDRKKERAEEIAWLYGQSLLKCKDYYTAAYQFKTFTRRYPYSNNIEEASFLAAYCRYVESPEYTLDQAITRDAITELENFADIYPQSIHMPEVNNCLDELRDKLMMKDYEIAVGYYTIESYNAAVVSLNNFLVNYPDSPKREEAMYYIIKAGYRYAINSREEKIKERLQQVVNNFDKFATTFKDSKHLSECQTIYTKSKALLAEMETKEGKK